MSEGEVMRERSETARLDLLRCVYRGCAGGQLTRSRNVDLELAPVIHVAFVAREILHLLS